MQIWKTKEKKMDKEGKYKYGKLRNNKRKMKERKAKKE